ncbi:hypothetical protein [Nocardia sp. NPDC058705]
MRTIVITTGMGRYLAEEYLGRGDEQLRWLTASDSVCYVRR